MKVFQSCLCSVLIALIFLAHPPARAAEKSWPGLDEAVNAPKDVWGEAAMRQPNGASYEFFENLLPPPRYVHADFRHYPLVLSAPNAKIKARLISNGSGVNLSGGSRSWKEVGVPVTFRVGPDEFRFGDLLERVSHPKLAEGYLPIVEITYRHPAPVQAEGFVPINQVKREHVPEVYRLEAFVSTDPALAENALVFVKFSLAAGTTGIISAEADPNGPVTFAEGRIKDEQGRALAYFDKRWQWERGAAHAKLTAGSSVTLAIPTKPLGMPFSVDESVYATHRTAAVKAWQDILDRGMKVEVPEPYVNNAWRNCLLQNFTLLNSDRIFYSAGNQYEQLYEAEGSDAALTLMNWGYEEDARRMFTPLLDFTRKGLEYHQAAFKLNDMARYWWQTRDTAGVQALRPKWEKELQRVLGHRTNEFGLLPKEQYCGDIKTMVFSLSVQAKAWRALHDMAPVLRALGDTATAAAVARAGVEYKARVLDAVMKSVRRETTPPFVPIALLADESIHSPITETRIGSYWNIIIGYVIGSRLFPTGSPEEAWLPHYLENHGGLCMGMTRSGGTAHGFWTGSDRVNPLYGVRYAVDTLRRDDPERALVSFYGMLAQGFTRNTFNGGEGCTLAPVDEGGRFFYCPPNSAANAHFLSMLRNMLVQDFDLDDDGEPETLRLLHGTSRRWLEDGKTIKVEGAPTAFGPVSVRVESRLSAGEVRAEVDLPRRNQPKRTLLRIRVPEGWRVISAESGGKRFPADETGAVDISSLSGKATLRFAVQRR
jgi:hypothetical protein